ncbi:hypothetical protein D039_1098B, partial [Vibrio parahaemolyticus EKP-028]
TTRGCLNRLNRHIKSDRLFVFWTSDSCRV